MIDDLAPVIDGVTLIQEFRAQGVYSGPIVFVTSNTMGVGAERALKAGANQVLPKPVTREGILKTVLRLMGHSRLDNDPGSLGHAGGQDLFDGCRVLLAEDDQTNQELAKAMLNELGVGVTVVDNGIEAVNAVNDKDFDAVFMDINMPGMDGYEATREIRKDRQFTELPIIAMTAHAMVESEKEGFEAGMSAYLTKPISLAKLKLVLQLQLESRSKFRNKVQQESAKVDADAANEGIRDENSLDQQLRLLNDTMNVQRLMRDTGIDVPTLHQILRVFYENNRNMATRLTQALDHHDLEQVRQLSHSLKGSSANVGANTVTVACETLERGCIAALEPDTLKEQLATVIEALTDVMTLLAELFSQEQASQKDGAVAVEEEGCIDQDKLALVGDLLMTALEDCEPSKIKMHFTELLALAGTRRTEKLKQLIDNFDYLAAADALRDILGS